MRTKDQIVAEIRKESVLASMSQTWSKHDSRLDELYEECKQIGDPDLYERARRGIGR